MSTLDDTAPAGLVLGSVGDLSDLLHELPEQDLLDLLDAAAEQDARDARPPNTRAAYAQDWAVWEIFCNQVGVEPTTVRLGLFYMFVKWLEQAEAAPATVGRRLAGVIVGLRDRDVVLPTKGGPAHKAWLEVKAYEMRLRAANIQRGRGKAPAVTRSQVCRICDRVPTDLYGKRAKAVLLLGLRFAARRSEVANLLATDIVTDPDGRGLEITVRATKGGETRTVAVLYGADPDTCPVRAWFAWRDAAGITTGPAFCHIQQRGCHPPTATVDKGLTGQTVGTIVAGLGRLIGVDLTGHSVRAGFVTLASDEGHDVAAICDITGHSLKSGTVYDYRRAGDRWKNTALNVAF